MAEDYPDEFDEFYEEEVEPVIEVGLSPDSELELSSEIKRELFHLLKEDYQDNYDLGSYEVILGQIFELMEVQDEINEEFEEDKPKELFVEYFYGLDNEGFRKEIDVSEYECDYHRILHNRRATVRSNLIEIIEDSGTEEDSEGVEKLSDNSTESGLEFNFGKKETSEQDSLENLTEEIEQSGPKEAIDEAYQGEDGMEGNGEDLNDVIDSFLQDDENSEDQVAEDQDKEESRDEATDEDVEEAVKDTIDEAFEKQDSD